MNTSWRTILLRAGILTAGFAVVVFMITFIEFKDARTMVIFGTVVMAVALVSASLLPSGDAPGKSAEDDLSGRPKG